jgi:uncharacterized phage-associated protein
MATAQDVAAYILKQLGSMPAMKLQKLAYYSQAWSLVWDDQPIFSDRIEAWANGPVIPSLYAQHRGIFLVETIPGDADGLTLSERETVDAVLKYYGAQSSQWLSDLTHKEDPWLDARHGLPPGARSTEEITQAAMHEYYSSL